MVNNSINIKNVNYHLKPLSTKKDRNIWRWKSKTLACDRPKNKESQLSTFDI